MQVTHVGYMHRAIIQPEVFRQAHGRRIAKKHCQGKGRTCKTLEGTRRCLHIQINTQANYQKAMQQGASREIIYIYAENAKRLEKQAVTFLKLSSRIEAVAERVQSAIRMHRLSRTMQSVVQGLSEALAIMDVEKVANIMEVFEKQSEDFEVQSVQMGQAVDRTSETSTPRAEVDELIQEVAEQHGLEISERMGVVPRQVSTTPAAIPDEFARRLSSLRE